MSNLIGYNTAPINQNEQIGYPYRIVAYSDATYDIRRRLPPLFSDIVYNIDDFPAPAQFTADVVSGYYEIRVAIAAYSDVLSTLYLSAYADPIYGDNLSAYANILYGDRVQFSQEVTYALLGLFHYQQEIFSPLEFGDPISAYADAPSPLYLSAYADVDYALKAAGSYYIDAVYDLRPYYELSFYSDVFSPLGFYAYADVLYGDKLTVSAYSDISSAFMQSVHAYDDLSDRLISDISAYKDPLYDIGTTVFLSSWADVNYSLLDDSIINSNVTVYAQVGTTLIDIISGSIDQGEGDSAWSCDLVLADPSTFRLFGQDEEFSVVVGADTYNFIRTSRKSSNSLSDTEPRQNYTVTGVSPIVKLDSPRAKTISKTYATAVTALGVVTELLPGFLIDWQIVNWEIPAYRLAFENVSPLGAAKIIVEAVKGVIESKPDGSLLVRYEYPNHIPAYPTDAIAHDFTDSDVLEIEDSEEANDAGNSVRIMDSDLAYSDQMVFEAGYWEGNTFFPDQDEHHFGRLSVYFSPIPAGPADYLLYSTRNGVTLSRVIEEYEILEETIEIVNGQGSVGKPIYDVQSLHWLDNDLQGVVYTQGSSEVHSTRPLAEVVDGVSLLDITYRAYVIRYRVYSALYGEAQFVLERK